MISLRQGKTNRVNHQCDRSWTGVMMIGGLPVVRSTGQTLSEAGRYLRRACTCPRCRQSKADGLTLQRA